MKWILKPDIFESSLKNFLVDNKNLEGFIKDKQTRIYHYTSAESLIKILEYTPNFSKGRKLFEGYSHLWSTDYNFLNDKTEGKAFFEDIVIPIMGSNKTLNEILKNKKVDRPHLKYIEFSIVDEDEKGEPIVEDCPMEYNWFLTSFSTDSDNLELWQYYTKNNKNEGYNIGFDLCKLLEINTKYEPLFASDVIYGDSKGSQKQEILDMIDIYENNVNETNIDFLKDCFYEVLCVKSLFYKKECFKNEKEYRILIRKEISKSNYRIVNGVVTPYDNIYFDRETVKEITISPTINPYLSKLGIRKFLQDNFYGNYDEQTGYGVKVEESKIPVRY